MTEDEWLACAEPQAMLDFLTDKSSDRKLRLFAVACCRRIWRFLSDSRSKEAIEHAEAFAEGNLAANQLKAAAAAAWEVHLQQHDAAYHASQAAVWATDVSPAFAAREAADAAIAATVCDPDDPEEDNIYQAMTLRCIVGNPFRASFLAPSWLRWHDGIVLKLAETIYGDRAFGQMPILADVLMDAGCLDEAILKHCRETGPHARGCWLIDKILGKE